MNDDVGEPDSASPADERTKNSLDADGVDAGDLDARDLGEDHSDSKDLDLGLFETPRDDGLSLEELSRTYAAMISTGEDPYQQIPLAEKPAAGPEPQAAVARHVDQQDVESDATDITPRSILEAMLFVGHPENEPLTAAQVAAMMRGVRVQEIDELVKELNEDYQQQRCPYRIRSVGAGYQLALLDEFGALRNKFYGRVREARLSQPAVDVLAVVAYQQPISKQQVERLRGKPSGSLLRQLVRRELLRIERTNDTPRETLYYTTDRFLDLFNLETLQDLPQSHELDRL